MSFIGEAALSALMEALLAKLVLPEMLSFLRQGKVDAEIKKWEKMLRKIQSVLEDAEEKQMTNKQVKMWLSELQDLAYDVEDILDEFAMESLQRKLEGEPQASTSRVRKLIPTCCTNFSPRAVTFNFEMLSKIKEITTRFKDITAQKDDLNLREIVVGPSRQVWQRPQSSCLQDEPQVYGRDEDKRKILDLLLSDETSSAKVGVVPVVGMGGVGKTTLARLVYNDEALLHFHPKAWVHVSEVFDSLGITKSILESITLKHCEMKELNQVQLALQKELAGKKFFIVLDDVWSENYEDWIALRPPFMNGAPGCRILVTTRSTIVAQKMGTVDFHRLESISDDDCWLLFTKHAFGNGRANAPANWEIIREKVITKCGGLPLAARTLGGLLRAKHENEWEDMLNSNIWNTPDDNSGILPVLRLSYHHLPSNLKRCFAYCAILPKDYEFLEKELILLWMAEGLIQPLDGERQPEDVGAEYFQDLLSRSLLQASIKGESMFVMHDLVNDLAQWVAGETSIKLEIKSMVGEQFKKERARHLSYIPGEFDGIKRFEPVHKMKCLRAFLPLPLYKGNCLTNNVPSDLLPKLRCLRVLSFECYNLYELPDSIGDLKRLRYLNLSYTKIRIVPEPATSLYSLQTLLLEGCRHIKKLPSRIGNLINLRHLDFANVNLVDGMPVEVKELKNLRTLSYFPVGKSGGLNISALANLKFLRGKLHITGLENVIDARHAWQANLIDKKDLDALLLEWKDDVMRNERLDKDILDGLQPHRKLKELTVKSYSGTKFSSWVGDPLFHNLVSIRLEDCKNCISLPQLGLLSSLKNLFVKGMSGVKQVGQEFCGGNNLNHFLTLETLHLIDMDELEEWNPCEVEFPCLHELEIKDCPSLSGKLPSHLSSIKRLVIRNCFQLVVLLPSLPMLCELEIRECKAVDFTNMVNFGSPTYVVLQGISNFLSLTEEFMLGLQKAKTLTIKGHFPCPRQFTSEASSQLEIMKLEFCESLLHWSLNLASLRLLTIDWCTTLVSFPEASFPPMLRSIRIRRCMALTSLPDYSNACLEDMEISFCNSLVSFGIGQLPPTLKCLEIRHCRNLQSLLDEEEGSFSSGNTSNLEYLQIYECDSLTSLSSGTKLLPRLKELRICHCSRLQSIAERFGNTSLEYMKIKYCYNLKSLPDNLHMHINLRKISIVHCPSLISFPCRGLPPSSLKRLQIEVCKKLEALPDNIHNLTSLQVLVLHNCQGIVSFPEEGFPANLVKLDISFSNICKPLFEWGLHRFASLRELCIRGGCSDLVSFPQDEMGMMLPTSLTDLSIGDFPNLEYLSIKAFQNLASLELLSVQNCPKLASFPKNLPPSLLALYINNCPLLKQSCQKNKGEEWSKIAHIPCVEIDMRSAFKPENDSEEDEMDSDEEDKMESDEEEMDTELGEEETDSDSEEEE
ncbi:putative disease resistance RPP13-like protein 1 [Hevea brasiliensis]|nr:putative disease resistance RPP13-like protein 1 [Hevea brasiliensis]